MLYIAQHDAQRLDWLDLLSEEIVASTPLPGRPAGLAVSPDGGRIYVSLSGPDSSGYAILDTKTRAVAQWIESPAMHGASGLAVSPGGDVLYICNRFANSIAIIALDKPGATHAPVPREPVACALSPDGSRLFVANHLPAGRADEPNVSAHISILDTRTKSIAGDIALPSGSGGLRGIACSPDGKFVFATHVLARFHMPTTQLERGWMNTNALTIADARKGERIATVLLDTIDRGAANPWGVAVSADAKTVAVAHAGTHELSLIDLDALMRKIERTPERAGADIEERDSGFYAAPTIRGEIHNDLSFLVDLRRRIPLGGNGPRAVAIVGGIAYAAEYFTDSLSAIDLAAREDSRPRAIALGPAPSMSPIRTGEKYFNDAQFCFQGWQSCASCHPDARADGLNWDLMNDGLGNPKNAKSMLLSHATPPVMATGVRADAETAVRAGLRFIQFAMRPEEDSICIDEYLKSLKPEPSPYLQNGELSEAARRGKALFDSPETGCSACHPEPLFTDMAMHNVGTKGKYGRHDSLDTPTLIETWRTAPYLSEGQCATMLDVLATGNSNDRHGRTSQLSEQQLEDLAEYVLSL